MKHIVFRKTVAMWLAGILAVSGALGLSAAADELTADPLSVQTAAVADYETTVTAAKTVEHPQEPLSVGMEDLLSSCTTEERDGQTGAVLSAGQKEVTFRISPAKAGLYHIRLRYYALSDKMKDIVISLRIGGVLPFSEAAALSLAKVYRDQSEITRDQSGNDIRPSQVEIKRWISALLADTNGYYDEPFAWQFAAGEQEITIGYGEETVLIAGLDLEPISELPAYAEYSRNAKPAKETLQLVEAEKSFEKSSPMLYPTYDRSTPATSPSHYSKIRYNTIGQSNWEHQGQWISWKIAVKESGWYAISLKARQNIQQGMTSCRTLYLDDEIPFDEARHLEFPYRLNWYWQTPTDANGNPCLFYLSAGEHVLKLAVSAGEMGSVLKSLSDSVLELNAIYRSIIMVTGTTPDLYRTYYLRESIPGLTDDLAAVREKLNRLYRAITEITGTGGSEASVIREMELMLGEFLEKPLEIPARVASFKDTIESMGSVLLSLSGQPLELDYIAVYANTELPGIKASFGEFLAYSVRGFLASFVEDYNAVSSAKSTENAASQVTVWISNGRDQAQILKNLIDNQFTPKTGIAVQMSIVSTAAGSASSPLVQATLAGKGPDVALFTPKDTPVNLAMRGALTDLSALSDFEEVYGRFYPSAWISYRYQNGIYAVPETQNYEMLFYRTDIFEELGIAPPQTWDEFYTVIEILQKNHLQAGVLETNSMNAGISSGIAFFEKQLLQNGGTYYTEDLKQTAFNTEAAYEAFRSWTELYAEYGLDRSFDFYNRFRTGEMPMGLMGYGVFNQLYAAAPEIRGLWKMALIPGTVREDGTIDHAETSSGTACVLLEQCREKESAWEFIKWWTGEEAQASYGTELEAALGIAARYDTANIAAFEAIGWTDEENAVLKSQWAEVTDVMQIPGNYFISRCLTNAFRTVVDEQENPVRALNIYNKDMNAEIARKRAEFGLD